MAEKVTIIPATAVPQYEETKRFIYIESCSGCVHCTKGAEEGGELKADAPEESIWYYCFHDAFKGFPRRIGQKNKTTEIAPFCPLEAIVKSGERERVPRKSSITSSGGSSSSIPSGMLRGLGKPDSEDPQT
jgi:hypothetical protein